jgi:hypothetical protein
MQYFYTVYLLLRSPPKLVSSFLESYFSSYEINKHLTNLWKTIFQISLKPSRWNRYVFPSRYPGVQPRGWGWVTQPHPSSPPRGRRNRPARSRRRRALLGNDHHRHDPLYKPRPENSVARPEELRHKVVGGNGGTASRRAVGHPIAGHDKAKGGMREL